MSLIQLCLFECSFMIFMKYYSCHIKVEIDEEIKPVEVRNRPNFAYDAVDR